MRKRGALPDIVMKQMIAAKHIIHGNEDHVGPASYDLTLDGEMYRLPGVVKPIGNETPLQMMTRMDGRRHNMDQPLETGVRYLAHIKERLNLPEGVYAYANPKSTAGRLFLDVRLEAEKTSAFDTLRPAYNGDLWVLLASRAFPIVLSQGDRLLQLRFFNADTRLDSLELSMLLEEHKLIRSRDGHYYNPQELQVVENDGACTLTLDLQNEPVGWECIRPNAVLKYNTLAAYRKEDFFRPVNKLREYLRMQQGSRLILSTKELVRVPPWLACEMRPFDARIANLRAHGAGFIDPGWGWGERGMSNGRPLTLEVEPYEDDIIVQEGEAIAKIVFEHLSEKPESHYDIGSPTYTDQMTARLAKQFV